MEDARRLRKCSRVKTRELVALLGSNRRDFQDTSWFFFFFTNVYKCLILLKCVGIHFRMALSISVHVECGR